MCKLINATDRDVKMLFDKLFNSKPHRIIRDVENDHIICNFKTFDICGVEEDWCEIESSITLTKNGLIGADGADDLIYQQWLIAIGKHPLQNNNIFKGE